MTQEYSDETKQKDPYVLPNLEVWSDFVASIDCESCGIITVPADHMVMEYNHSIGVGAVCPECQKETPQAVEISPLPAYWFWFCFPGCLPDSAVFGPFAAEKEALEEARENNG